MSGPNPLVKLTRNLGHTYYLINRKFYAGRRQLQAQQIGYPVAAVQSLPVDDEHHDYIVRSGECLIERYVLDVVVGKGSYGQVVRAYDRLQDRTVAIKIIKSLPSFTQQSAVEIRILAYMKQHAGEASRNIVLVDNTFRHYGHQCIVCEMLSVNLYEVIRETRYVGISLNAIRVLSRQLIEALKFLKDHCIIHCDLKPENVLLVHANKLQIKLIDFGSSCFADQQIYTYVQSRFYRAPEVLLGYMPYAPSIDMWSLGCLMVELHTGEPLFNGMSEADQVVKLVALLGNPSNQILESGRKSALHFVRKGKAFQLKNCPGGIKRRSLAKVLGVDTGGPRGRCRQESFGHERADYLRFLNLIQRMLEYDPDLRIRPEDALDHAFFRDARTQATPAVPPASASTGVSSVAPTTPTPSTDKRPLDYIIEMPSQQFT